MSRRSSDGVAVMSLPCYDFFMFLPTGLLLPVHIAKGRAIPLIPSSASPYQSHCHTHGELVGCGSG